VPDDSHLDAQYFIDKDVYNCPFCNRRHVSYKIKWTQDFDWTDSKKCRAIFVQCESCEKQSMHLTFADISVYYSAYQEHRFKTEDIDVAIFYSVPSSFHVIDERIPKNIRELLTEAEGCLKSNFLTGASACARKLIRRATP